MIRPPPSSTRTDTLFPYPTLFRSPGHTNDMVVDRQGRAYVGKIGFDFDQGAEPGPTILTLVRPDGTVEIAAEDMLCPNGSVITDDGKRLIVAEDRKSTRLNSSH